MVELQATVSNTGNTRLRNVAVEAAGFSSFTCPSSEVAIGSSITCTAKLEFTSQVMALGTRSFTAVVKADGLEPPASSSPVTVVVLLSPSVTLNIQAAGCTKPAQLREYPLTGCVACNLCVLAATCCISECHTGRHHQRKFACRR
jgi:hypothetical protein